MVGEFLTPVPQVHPRTADPDLSRYIRSYLILRVLVGSLGIALPFLVVYGDLWLFGGDAWRSSLSSYYYSGARDVFVGALSATGVFLLTYKVAERNLDNAFSLLAGVAVLVVAQCPTGLPEDVDPTPLQARFTEAAIEKIHYGGAIAFIVSLGVISFLFGLREGDPNRPDREQMSRSPRFWRTFHWTCAGVIGAALIFMLVCEVAGGGPARALLYGEWVSVCAFGVSWLWKGLELDTLLGRPPAPRRGPSGH